MELIFLFAGIFLVVSGILLLIPPSTVYISRHGYGFYATTEHRRVRGGYRYYDPEREGDEGESKIRPFLNVTGLALIICGLVVLYTMPREGNKDTKHIYDSHLVSDAGVSAGFLNERNNFIDQTVFSSDTKEIYVHFTVLAQKSSLAASGPASIEWTHAETKIYPLYYFVGTRNYIRIPSPENGFPVGKNYVRIVLDGSTKADLVFWVIDSGQKGDILPAQ